MIIRISSISDSTLIALICVVTCGYGLADQDKIDDLKKTTFSEMAHNSSPLKIDFGIRLVGTSATKEVQIANDSIENFSTIKVRKTCNCVQIKHSIDSIEGFQVLSLAISLTQSRPLKSESVLDLNVNGVLLQIEVIADFRDPMIVKPLRPKVPSESELALQLDFTQLNRFNLLQDSIELTNGWKVKVIEPLDDLSFRIVAMPDDMEKATTRNLLEIKWKRNEKNVFKTYVDINNSLKPAIKVTPSFMNRDVKKNNFDFLVSGVSEIHELELYYLTKEKKRIDVFVAYQKQMGKVRHIQVSGMHFNPQEGVDELFFEFQSSDGEPKCVRVPIR